MTSPLPLIAAALLLAWAVPVVGQEAPPAGAFPSSERPVAAIVSPIWWNDASRDAADESGQLVRALGIRPGMAVADIGAGSGYHTLRLAPVVGPRGWIYAQDVMEDYLADLGKSVTARRLTNVEIVLGRPDNPGLNPGSVDRAIMVHMFHEVAEPYALLYNLATALRPDAKVGVVDLDRPTWDHGTPPATLRCEFEAVGYRMESLRTLNGGVGYLAIFTPPPPGRRPAPQDIRRCENPL